MSLFAAPSMKIENKNATQEATNSENDCQTFSREIIDSISLCAICYSKFNDSSKIAKILHCGHSFCNECLLRVNEYGNSLHFECPTCRSETKCSIDKIPVNYHLMEILQKLDILSKEKPIVEVQNSQRQDQPQQQGNQNEEKPYFNEGYRQLLIRVKSAIMARLDDCKEEGVLDDEEKFNRAVSRLSDDIEIAIEEADMLSSSDDEDDSDNSIEASRNVDEQSIDFESVDDMTLSDSSSTSSSESDF